MGMIRKRQSGGNAHGRAAGLLGGHAAHNGGRCCVIVADSGSCHWRRFHLPLLFSMRDVLR